MMMCQSQRVAVDFDIEGLHGTIMELDAELSVLHEIVEEKDAEIGVLRETIDEMRDRGMQWLRISGIEWNIDGDALTVSVANFGDMPRSISSIGVRRNTTESTWYTVENPISIGGGESVVSIGGSSFIWTESSSQAPMGFLDYNTAYVVAIVYYGGYDEVVAVSPHESYHKESAR